MIDIECLYLDRSEVVPSNSLYRGKPGSFTYLWGICPVYIYSISDEAAFISSNLLRSMSVSDSIELNVNADVPLDAIEVFVLRSRLVSTGDLVIRVYVVYHCVIP